MLDALLIIAAGILAASGLIIARRPDAAKLIDKLSVGQGWIGVVLFFWGTWRVIWVLLNLGIFSVSFPLALVVTVVSALEMILGFLLGFGLITHWTLRGNAMAMARGQAIRQKLAKYQGTFGLAGIAAGLLLVVLNVVL
jgi:hypothetical protein